MSHSPPIDDFYTVVCCVGDVHLAALQVDIGVVVTSFAVWREADPANLSEHEPDASSPENLGRVF